MSLASNFPNSSSAVSDTLYTDEPDSSTILNKNVEKKY